MESAARCRGREASSTTSDYTDPDIINIVMLSVPKRNVSLEIHIPAVADLLRIPHGVRFIKYVEDIQATIRIEINSKARVFSNRTLCNSEIISCKGS